MHPQKFKNVMALSAPERYAYFVRTAANWETVWGLQKADGRWIVSQGQDGVVVYPFWPEKAFAEAAAIDAWSEAKATALPLDAFRAAWLPGMQRDGAQVGIFWVPPDMVGIDVEPEVLRKDLEDQCAQYED